jgi:hypothetical protein
MSVAVALVWVLTEPTLSCRLIRRLENTDDSFYRITEVSKDGSVSGWQGHMGLHDGYTEPVYFNKGRRTKHALHLPKCALPNPEPIPATDPLFSKYPTPGAKDSSGPDGGQRYKIKPGVEICNLKYEQGMQYCSQVVVFFRSGKSRQLSEIVPGLKGFATTHLLHIDSSGWMLVAGFRGKFYTPNRGALTGTMGAQLYWISFK